MYDTVISAVLDAQTTIECNVENKEVKDLVNGMLDKIINKVTAMQIKELIENNVTDTYDRYRMEQFLDNVI